MTLTHLQVYSYPSDATLALYLLASHVRPCVTSRSCSKTAKHRIVQTTLDNSQGLYFDDANDLYESPKMPVRWVKIAFFDRSRSLRLRRLTAENLCPSATVVRVHKGALAEKYVVSSTTLVVLESDDHCYVRSS